MGGDRAMPSSLCFDEESFDDIELSELSFSLDPTFNRRESKPDSCSIIDDAIEEVDETPSREHELVYEELERRISPNLLEIQANKKRRFNTYRDVLKTYDHLLQGSQSLKKEKGKILSYSPGRWVEKVGGLNLSNYDVPDTTTLLLIGPKGSGKSSLINRISKFFEDGIFACERAQVSYDSSTGDGTFFLHEYMIPRNSSSFCLYDTRSLLDNSSDNYEMLKNWITNGVRHGELILRPSDDSSLRTRLKHKARKSRYVSSRARMVNFVIFVVNGVEVLRLMEGNCDTLEGGKFKQMTTTFNCPYLSFKDDKPVVVVTHGDLLSIADRARIRVYLGQLLGIPPAKQIFDIPESFDPVTGLMIVNMLRYCLEHADKNLPHKNWLVKKVCKISISTWIYIFVILSMAILSIYMQYLHIGRSVKSKEKFHVDWHNIRHLWLE
ncbi:hypothetical protein K2173_018816 [Erythroxylum novogranatense]|uniref:Uncharacterized protein n=1 Tax=Erythroxylum novogranatense TaxID=1862640 RepID=A0AAV8SAU1_9ROSI|nr:hypothetical protein K2173_018816 [Erythroxylum novogranatense]